MALRVLPTVELALKIWPEWPHPGERMHFAFRVPTMIGTERQAWEVTVHSGRRQLATVALGVMRPVRGVVCVEWDGRLTHGDFIMPGRYTLRVAKLGSSDVLERTLFIAE